MYVVLYKTAKTNLEHLMAWAVLVTWQLFPYFNEAASSGWLHDWSGGSLRQQLRSGAVDWKASVSLSIAWVDICKGQGPKSHEAWGCMVAHFTIIISQCYFYDAAFIKCPALQQVPHINYDILIHFFYRCSWNTNPEPGIGQREKPNSCPLSDYMVIRKIRSK